VDPYKRSEKHVPHEAYERSVSTLLLLVLLSSSKIPPFILSKMLFTVKSNSKTSFRNIGWIIASFSKMRYTTQATAHAALSLLSGISASPLDLRGVVECKNLSSGVFAFCWNIVKTSKRDRPIFQHRSALFIRHRNFLPLAAPRSQYLL